MNSRFEVRISSVLEALLYDLQYGEKQGKAGPTLTIIRWLMGCCVLCVYGGKKKEEKGKGKRTSNGFSNDQFNIETDLEMRFIAVISSSLYI